MVLFQGLDGGVGRHRVKVQIQRMAMRQAGLLELLEPGVHQPQIGAVVHPRTIGRQVASLGNHIEAGKQGDGRVEDQIHHVALTLGAQQLERQQAAHRLLSGNHLRAGQTTGLDNPAEVDALQQGYEQKQAREGGAKRARRQIQAAHIGDLSGLWRS